ncbi:phage tail protein [Puia sp.]|uniref:phage tail protein n=1 Tax=Puia sp. TaxID=2045100 RepID=UPI002F409303
MADPTKTYPLPKFHFQVSWGKTRMGFTEVTGLDFETEVIEYREGNSKLYNKLKQPGLTKYSNVTLKRGTFLGDFDYYELWKQTYFFQESSAQFRTNVVIQLMDEQHKPIITWSLANAWPTKIQATDLKADANEVAIETMELVHEGLTITEAP